MIPARRPLLVPAAALMMVALFGCDTGPIEEPPTAAPPVPTLTITSPLEADSVVTSADGDRSVAVSFTVEGATLRAPGTCLASEAPCGHVAVRVDEGACALPTRTTNSVAAASPARAALALCDVAAGSHLIELRMAHDDRSDWLGASGAPIAASVRVSVTVPGLLERVGGVDGMDALAAAMVTRQLAAQGINAYFRNASIDHTSMATCMAAMFVSVAGQQPPAAGACSETDMTQVHAGLGVSTADFDDWMAELRGALAGLGVAAADADEFAAQIGALSGSIVEDPSNDATLYQRLGRRPGLWAAVQVFVNHLLADPLVARYFLDDDGLPDYSPTFGLCLMRQLGSLDGPFIYGEGFPLEPILSEEGRACRPMLQAHDGMTSAPPEASPIGPEEFLQVAGILVDTLIYLQVPQEDIDLLVAAMNLPALCSAIIADPGECLALFP